MRRAGYSMGAGIGTPIATGAPIRFRFLDDAFFGDIVNVGGNCRCLFIDVGRHLLSLVTNIGCLGGYLFTHIVGHFSHHFIFSTRVG